MRKFLSNLLKRIDLIILGNITEVEYVTLSCFQVDAKGWHNAVFIHVPRFLFDVHSEKFSDITVNQDVINFVERYNLIYVPEFNLDYETKDKKMVYSNQF